MRMHSKRCLLLLAAIVCHTANAAWRVGRALYDVTGPVAGVELNGYHMPYQIAQGVHMRLYSRAFIFVDDANSDERLVFCSVDTPAISQNVKAGVLRLLQAEYGVDMYTHRNVILSATHTHAGTGGFHDYLLYSITSLGYVDAAAQALIVGTFKSIQLAHRNLQPANLWLTSGQLPNANINRSPTAYAANPRDERDYYAAEGNTDKLMTVLRIGSSDNDTTVGMIAWFPVHTDSMNNTNRLVSGDNKGYASYLAEQEAHYSGHPPQSRFVAAFAQSNEGDVSPNIEGTYCLDTGKPCTVHHSTCPDAQGNHQNGLCHGRGPGWRTGDEESTRIIGLRQYARARQLLRDRKQHRAIHGGVQVAHAWIDLANTTVRLANGSTVHTCPPARGYAFGAGTSDGPGMGDFIQGYNGTENPFWSLVSSLLSKPSKEQKACHWPKPILLNTGEITVPYPWEPRIVDIQIARLGSLIILAVPGELTTMAGRRLRRAVRAVFRQAVPDAHVVIAGLSNTYSGYVTTREEYAVQRYEGASTIYGPNTLQAYIQEFRRLAHRMVAELGHTEPPPVTPIPVPSHSATQGPKSFSDRLLSLLPPVLFDAVPLGRSFGQVVDGQDVRAQYYVGDTVRAVFHAGHPRVMAEVISEQLATPFMQVERYTGPGVEELRSIARELALSAGWNVAVFATASRDTLQFAFSPLFSVQPGRPLTGGNAITKTFPMAVWTAVRDDNDWDTKFKWDKPFSDLMPLSRAHLEWTIGRDAQSGDIGLLQSVNISATHTTITPLDGTYRLVYHGAHKLPLSGRHLHTGHSSTFTVCSVCNNTQLHHTASDNTVATFTL